MATLPFNSADFTALLFALPPIAPGLGGAQARMIRAGFLDADGFLMRGAKAPAITTFTALVGIDGQDFGPLWFCVRIRNALGHRLGEWRWAMPAPLTAPLQQGLALPVSIDGPPGDYCLSLWLEDQSGARHGWAVDAVPFAILPGAAQAGQKLICKWGEPNWQTQAGRSDMPVSASLFRTPQIFTGDDSDEMPVLVHLSHYKAGSQWIRRIIEDLAPLRRDGPVRHQPWPLGDFCIRPGLHSAVYATYETYLHMGPRPHWRPFVVIRDLRDTLVSAYFSYRYSLRGAAHDEIPMVRERLSALSLEDGLIYLLEHYLWQSADIQWSWLRTSQDVPVWRYEDLLHHDEERLAPFLMDCIGADHEKTIRAAIRRNRFEAATGRARGQEDLHSHQRRAAPGDWRNHFTARIAALFNHYYGDLLIAAGYEKGRDWS